MSFVRSAAIAILGAAVLAACSPGDLGATVKRGAFSAKEYGVGVSPRVSRATNPPRGGGRYMVGKPYTVRGRVFTPVDDPHYVATGTGSWYGSDFHGRLTANGEIFSANAITAAHPTLPLPSYVRVTNLENGRSLLVRVNDRGPFLQGRLIDLSHRAAEMLGYVNKGSANVEVQYVSPAPLNGDDTRMLVASLNQASPIERNGVRVASGGDKPTIVGSIGDLIGSVLSYSEASTVDVGSAVAAAEAMATRPGELAEWQDAVDEESRRMRLQLGVFKDANAAREVELAFALIGAVDEGVTEAGDTVLTLTYLKPGVTRDDVLALVREQGLVDVIPY